VFVKAIEQAAAFTRPIHIIVRFFGSTEVHPGAASLFFVNADGWALTCRHVAEQLITADRLAGQYKAFKSERESLDAKHRRQAERGLQRKYGLDHAKPAEIANRFVNCVEGPLNLKATLHSTLDAALLKFDGFTKLGCSVFPVFAKSGTNLKQGQFLCRLGFPFPEFKNFAYDSASDSIGWTQQGQDHTPQFPIEGMVTRHLLGPGGDVVGFELSTPGLRGQSGGPAFDIEGRVWGMQARTAHLDLDFDVDMEVVREGHRRQIKDSAILHVGHCVGVEVLKAFMRDHGVLFLEG
jgi:hypothetical protein